METLLDMVRSTWDSFFGKLAILVLCVGWVPFYLLGMVKASLIG